MKNKEIKAIKFISENIGFLTILTLFIVLNQASLASGAGLPFEGQLDKIMESITGPVAKSLAIIAVASCGLAMAFGEMGGAMKKLVNIVFGISIVFAATSWVPTFFGFSGGVGF
ncbi:MULTISPECIES: TrbC/VirB2 family protein [Psychrilyobacter]|uniref:Conjugal transfer protein TrbC n=1 Tax=Psychrilyobacter piezotolerans TaxID=2293438 RepID=A0ABX9KIV8_9FUSO|nr:MULTISPECIES: TrbC/VirB2 family protein [Psychrilyobacter]MCS5420280.1 TrbC/VirB2 family protein [Psychrilyobacter sp. S5]NDI77305.1 TrbC/VirB2 family protein [Psychrilyobacter piezotolerans]RDE63359.1 conjugal transfer protein TrbC [Psychrilyobacter sp. S5]REI41901.1 conjugal transfer protein TrbC [Psychrilyobacter piezotolerans]